MSQHWLPAVCALTIEEHPDLKPKWTKSGRGQARFKGFALEGVELCKELAKKCRAERKKEHCPPMEQCILAKVREKNQIPGECTVEQWNRSKKKKSTTAVEDDEGVEDLWGDSD